MSNNLLTISYITNEGLVVLENELVFTDGVDKQYSSEFAVSGAKIGAVCNVRRPPRYLGTFGPALNVEDTNETYIPVPLNYQFHVDVQFTTADLLLSMDQFRSRVLQPIMATVANRVDSDGLYFAYQQTAQAVGTFGTPAASYLTYALANAQLVNEAVPAGPRRVCIDPITAAYAADGVKGLFNPQINISEFYRKGMINRETAGLDWYTDQNVVSFQTGPGGGSPTLANVAHSGIISSGWAQQGFIETTGWTAAAAPRVKVGDIIQIAGVYPVNPQSRTRYGNTLKQFVVLPPGGYLPNPVGTATPGLKFAPATLASGTFNEVTGEYSSTAAGALSIMIGEVAITGGQFQNCTAPSSATAAITVNGGAPAGTVSPQGIAYHRTAFALASADLPLPRGVQDAARASDPDIGMSMRMVTQYTINNDAMPTRVDILYGWASLYRNMAVRVLS
ncbi:MAG: hypothetical protein IRZ07_00825 [Microbispora sp.]|nr:hypothetical protein [Microbispora sp.]